MATANPGSGLQLRSLIKASGDASYLGEGIFNTDGTGQTRSLSIKAGRSATFIVNTQNDGSATDTFTILERVRRARSA